MICRLKFSVCCKDGMLHLRHELDLPCVPREGDWVGKEEALIKVKALEITAARGIYVRGCDHVGPVREDTQQEWLVREGRAWESEGWIITGRKPWPTDL